MINKAVLVLTLACSASVAIAGHHEKGEKADHNSAAWQIKAYSSAAPDFLGDLRPSLDLTAQCFARGRMAGFVSPPIRDLFPRQAGVQLITQCQPATMAKA